MSADISFASLALGLLLVQTFKAGRKRFKEHNIKYTRINRLNLDKTPLVNKHNQYKAAYRRKLAAVKQFCNRGRKAGYRDIEMEDCIGHHRGHVGMQEAKAEKKGNGEALSESQGLLRCAGQVGAKGQRN